MKTVTRWINSQDDDLLFWFISIKYSSDEKQKHFGVKKNHLHWNTSPENLKHWSYTTDSKYLIEPQHYPNNFTKRIRKFVTGEIFFAQSETLTEFLPPQNLGKNWGNSERKKTVTLRILGIKVGRKFQFLWPTSATPNADGRAFLRGRLSLSLWLSLSFPVSLSLALFRPGTYLRVSLFSLAHELSWAYSYTC